MSLPSVLIRKSTGEIIKRGKYPREDMGPIIGLDPDLEWLIRREPFIAPDYDSRIFVLIQNEAITTTPDDEFTHLNQYQITYATEKRSDEDINISVDNAERGANESIFPYEKQLKIVLLGLGVLFRKVDGMVLNNKEQKIANRVIAMGTRMWKNDQVGKDKKTEVINGTEPNIDFGWEKGE